jgi:hypothetical protein
MLQHATPGGGLELDDDLSQFISSLTGSCEEASAEGAGGARGYFGGAMTLPDRARDSPPSVGAQPRLAFPSADALEALQATAAAPRASTDRGAMRDAGGIVGAGRLRRSHTYAGAPTPSPAPALSAAVTAALRAPAPRSARKRSVNDLEAEADAHRSDGTGGGASFMHMMLAGGGDERMDITAAAPRAPAGLRRSFSLPMVPQPGARGTTRQISALLDGAGGGGGCSTSTALHGGGGDFCFGEGGSGSDGLLPEWARERPPGGPPLLTPAGLPTFAAAAPPPAGAPPTSRFRGVSRAPWSTRWDAHATGPATAAGPLRTIFCGSFDAEERAARAHDLATLKLHMADAQHGGVSFHAMPACNFAVGEYAALEELAGVPEGEFLDAVVASAYEPTERRYSKYRGVFRPTGAPKGALQWEGRLEEAPASAPPQHAFSHSS